MGQVTTVGKVLLRSNVPSKYHSFIQGNKLNAHSIGQFFDRVSKETPNAYGDISTNLTRLGFEVATRQGSSVGLEDLISPVDKTKRVNELNKKIEGIKQKNYSKSKEDDKITGLYQEFMQQLNEDIVEEGLRTDKTLAKIIAAGSRGSPTQYRQTVSAQGLTPDNKGKPMLSMPIMSSFAEGLTLPEYLAHTFGARQGLVGTKISVADAGYGSKQLTRAAMPIIVETHDCGTHRGVPYSTKDKDSVGLYLAKGVGGFNRNNEVTSKMLDTLRNKGVKEVVVRSPMTCQASKDHHHGAVCQMCIGIREKYRTPDLGEYIGITAATTLGERLAQGSLNSKHQGGSVNLTKGLSGFKGVNQLMNIPKNFRHKALVADQDGVITDIQEASQGGTYVFTNGKSQYLPTGYKVTAKKGQKVEAGDVLSEGVPNPAEITKYKGIGEGRRYYSQVMHDTFKDSGIKLNRRNFETIARAAIDHVRVDDPDGLGDYLPDSIVSYQNIERDYKLRVGHKESRVDAAHGKYMEKPELHYTIGTRVTKDVQKKLEEHGVDSVTVHDDKPQFTPVMQRLLDVPAQEPDWMHQLYSTWLEKRFLNSVNSGATAHIKGPSPIAGLAYGKGFGKSAEDEDIPTTGLDIPLDPLAQKLFGIKDELTRSQLVGLIASEKGGNPGDYDDILNRISFAESTLNPNAVNPQGGASGLFQFLGNSLGTAGNRLTNFLKKQKIQAPDWLSNLGTDASKLTPDQQAMLFLGDVREKPGADIGKVIAKEQPLSEFWANSWWAGPEDEREDKANWFDNRMGEFEGMQEELKDKIPFKSEAPSLENLEMKLPVAPEDGEDAFSTDGVKAGEATTFSYGCVMAYLAKKDSKHIEGWIDKNIEEKDLHEENEMMEQEESLHLTILYGFHEDVTPEDVEKVVKGHGPITLTLGPVSRFENKESDGYDVLIAKVSSLDANYLNKLLNKKFKGKITNSYKDYNPHVTLAYVKPGKCKALDGEKRFAGEEYVVRELIYSTPGQRKLTPIAL